MSSGSYFFFFTNCYISSLRLLCFAYYKCLFSLSAPSSELNLISLSFFKTQHLNLFLFRFFFTLLQLKGTLAYFWFQACFLVYFPLYHCFTHVGFLF